MADTYLNIVVDDDTGTPSAPNYDGTPLDSVFFTDLEAILNEFITRATKIVGGVWTWESPGLHVMSASSTGPQGLHLRNTNTGTSAQALLQLGNSLTADMGRLYTTSTSNSIPNTLFLDSKGAGGTRFTVSGGGAIYISGVGGGVVFPGNTQDTMVMAGNNITPTTTFHNNAGQGVGQNTGLLIGENIATFNTATGSSYGTQANTSLPSWALDLGGARGNDGIPWVGDHFGIYRRSAASTWAKMMSLAVVSSIPYLTVGRSAVGNAGSIQVGEGASSPVSGHVLFGGDGSGWELRLGRNNAGTITHYWSLNDSGHFGPVTGSTYNFGSSSSRVATGFFVNLGMTGVLTGATITPASDGAGTVGSSGLRWGALYVVDANFGDVSFDNGWSITEGAKVGLGDGLAFVNQEDELCAFLNGKGELYADLRPLWLIKRDYVKKTKQERLGGR